MIKQLLPKGKYNGLTIQGVKISFAFKLLRPAWKPVINLGRESGQPYIVWLWFTVRFYLEFDYD